MTTSSNSTVDQILAHLCEKHQFGDVTEWCEMRNDCVYVVTCPDCRHIFTLVDGEYDELIARSRELMADSCGIRLPAD